MLNFDLEANGLLDTIKVIHCVTIGGGDQRTRYRPHEVKESFQRLLSALEQGEQISGHNIINFDVPAIEKIDPDFRVPRTLRHLIVDTLVLSRLIFPHLNILDLGLLRSGKLPKNMYKKHSLRAWGFRLGQHKGDFALHTDEDADLWERFTEEMMDYNEQDVVVGTALLNFLLGKGYSEKSIQLEHEVAWLMAQQERNGFPFNMEKAKELEIILRAKASELKSKLIKQVPPIPDKDFIPKRDNKRLGYIKGQVVKRFKEFNPGSRQQIEWIVTKYFDYQPTEIEIYNLPDDVGTKMSEDEVLLAISKGKYPLKIDADTFTFMKEDPECPSDLQALAKIFEEYLTITKRLGQLADGKQAWMTAYKEADGMIHGRINPNGAVTGRATHSTPNMGQVPSVKSPYGKECRELFGVPEGWYQVGTDASSLELRCLAHYMAPFDNGAYGEIVVNGSNADGTDVHSVNMRSAGLTLRDQAKTFIYAYLYGAGDAKIGKIVGGSKAEGKRLKKEFLAKTPALALLRQAIKSSLVESEYHGRVTKYKRKYLIGLDGRQLHVRSLHSALNTLLQSAGAVICKKWIVLTEQKMIDAGYRHGWDGDFALMAWVHDEMQCACRNLSIAEDFARFSQEAMRETQEYFNFRVQLDTEAKIGKNWYECH